MTTPKEHLEELGTPFALAKALDALRSRPLATNVEHVAIRGMQSRGHMENREH
jgi:hypothetical protein